MTQPNLSPVEKELRDALKIPDTATHVLVACQASHMDWDWKLPFSSLLHDSPPDAIDYFSQKYQQRPVTDILGKATGILTGPTAASYYYSITEIGFLRGWAELPSQADLYRSLQRVAAQPGWGNHLRIVGGGITSPDNLLPHGEAFIRNFLVGQRWLRANMPGLLPLRNVWIPDDFGHDSQLPVVLEAMGFTGVGFSRLPKAQVAELTAQGAGVDFWWVASDGSAALGHWMQNGYNQGDGLRDGQWDLLVGMYWANAPASPTDYVFVPVGGDFQVPVGAAGTNPFDLSTLCAQFNASAQRPAGAYAVAATFDHYAALVQAYGRRTPPPREIARRPFAPTPYWTGFYASRPELKILHYGAARALLAAESLALMAAAAEAPDAPAWIPSRTARRNACLLGWDALAPSTHHDYITGTATDGVYTGEQVPLLRSALALGEGAGAEARAAIASLVLAQSPPYEVPVVVFNSLGFARGGVVEVPAPAGFAVASVRGPRGTAPVQRLPSGNLLFAASAPALGWETYYLSPAPPGPASDVVRVGSLGGGEAFRLTNGNGELSATISRNTLWGISSMTSDGVEMIGSGGANTLQFYVDRGTVYQFGNELGFDPDYWEPNWPGLVAGEAAIVESGPLRAVVRTWARFSMLRGTVTGTYVRDYTLVAGEPFLRMSVTGAAPMTAGGHPAVPPTDRSADPTAPDPVGIPFSVMVRFHLRQDLRTDAQLIGFQHGTPCHWAEWYPKSEMGPYPPFFQATHGFVLPRQGSGDALPAFYHRSLPACAVDRGGALIACVLRNTPGGYAGWLGANGGDPDVHTHHYALRIPGVGAPATGQPLRESMSEATPLAAVAAGSAATAGGLGAPTAGTLGLGAPPSFSLADITSTGSAVLTAAKPAEGDPGAMVLRVYRPGPAGEPVTVSLAGFAARLAPGGRLAVSVVTALENVPASAPTLTLAGTDVTFTPTRALTTLLVTPTAA